jgi:DNA-binding IclR family transcriptional regulator
VLDTIAVDAPQRGLTQSELRRKLGYSQGNLLAILASMEASGHVRRDPVTRAYTLGPALLAIGDAASQTYPAVRTAMPYMEKLAAELGTECRAGMRVGPEILVVARVGPKQPPGYGVRVGERFPLVAPLGMPHIAWSSAAEIDAYLAEAALHLDAGEVERLSAALVAVRSKGYSINLEAGPRRALSETAGRIVAEASREAHQQRLTELVRELGHHQYVVADPEQVGEGQVLHIGAPVFGPEATVELVVGIGFVTPHLAGRSLADVAARVAETTAAVTRALGGHPLVGHSLS